MNRVSRALFCYTPPAVRLSVLLIVLCLTGACRKPHEARLSEGDSAAASGRWDDARTKWEAAVSADASSAVAHARLGAALWHLDRRDDAQREWAEAVKLDATNEDALEGLARFALEARDAGAAVSLLSTISEPSSPSFKKVQARALLARGEPGDAAAALELASSNDADAESRYLVGCAELALRRFGDAQTTLDALLRAHPASPLGSYGLARLAAAQQRQTDVLLNLATAKAAAGSSWNAAHVAADPAFAFLATAPEFKALVGP